MDDRASGTADGAPRRSAASTCCRTCSPPAACSRASTPSSRPSTSNFERAGMARVRRHDLRRARRAHRALDQHRKRLRQGVRQPRRHGGLRPGAGDRRLPVGRGAHRGVRPALGAVRLARRFFYAVAAALRLARFNARSASADKRYFEGLPSPSAAAIVAAFVWFFSEWREPGLPGLIAAFAVTGHRRGAHGVQLQLPELQAVRPRQAHQLRLHAAGAARSSC